MATSFEKISSFLAPGKGVWWSTQNGEYRFFDGYHDPNFHDEGPCLLHQGNTQIHGIYSRNEKLWQQIIDHNIPLPTTSIKVFDHKGNIKELQTYSDIAATEQLSVSQLGTSCTGSTAHLEQAMPSVLADSTGTKLSPTCTQMGSGLQVSSASKEKTNSEHSTGQLACCVSRSHSCIALRSTSNYSNQ